MYLYLFQVQFNNSVRRTGYTYIFIPGWNSIMTFKQQFDWIIKTGWDHIGRQIDYLNTNIFKE